MKARLSFSVLLSLVTLLAVTSLPAARLDKHKPILVNCHAGSRGAIASTELAKLGFKTICNLAGGLAAWEKDGRQAETRTPP